ncbi:MAG TPA: ATP-binding protein [Sulfurospirillum arcachonense]|nr:ATP-binding protein [Sulfurospirillum arcachonense]
MRDFESAGVLFRDDINPKHYFDSSSAEIAKNRIKEAIDERNAPLIFLIGDPGVGKSYILKLLNEKIKNGQLTVFIDHPFFDKRDLLKLLYEAKGMEFDREISFNTLKDELVKEYKDTTHTIFIDEAQLLNEEQFELIRILSDTKVLQFVLSMHKEEGSVILEKKHFRSRTKVVVNYGKLDSNEVYRYIQSTLISNSYSEIALMFSKKDAKKIAKYTDGNFRTIKKFLYVLMKLLNYAKVNGIKKYQKLHPDLIMMAALDLGMIHD